MVLYFGPLYTVGHYFYNQKGQTIRPASVNCPWTEYMVDGVLQPGCMFKFMTWNRNGGEKEGEALLYHLQGWTALSFWDRTIDKRGACNSTFFVDQWQDFDAMIAEAQKAFPKRWELIKFPVFQSMDPKNSLLCSMNTGQEPHDPTILHRSGGVSADVLNVCSRCGFVIGNYHGLWTALDSWSLRKVRETGSMQR